MHLEASGEPLRSFWSRLGPSIMDILTLSGAIFGQSWGILGIVLRLLGGHLKVFLGRPGPLLLGSKPLGRFGTVLDVIVDLREPSWRPS